MNDVINDAVLAYDAKPLENETPNAAANAAGAESPLKSGNTADQTTNGKKKLKNDIIFYGGIAAVILFVAVFFVPKLLGSGAPQTGESQSAEIIDEPQNRQNNSAESTAQSEQIANLSDIILEQKNQIQSLNNQAGQFKLAITQNKKDIEALKLKLAISGSVSADRHPASAYVPESSRVAIPDNRLLTAFKINNMDKNIAWITYKGKTYALQRNDTLGGVTVLTFDVQNRIVITDKGIIK